LIAPKRRWSILNKLCRCGAHFDFRLNRGVALAQLRRFVEAIAEFDAVLVQHRAGRRSFQSRQCAHRLGRVEEAIAAYDRALALRPKYLKALTSRGVAFQASIENREAIADYDVCWK